MIENSDDLRDRLHALLRGLASKRTGHHAIAAVERVDGSFRWAGSIGHATPDGTPLRNDTPFFLASVTKLFIAAVVMKLVEERGIDPDAPITTYLPRELTTGLHRRTASIGAARSRSGTCSLTPPACRTTSRNAREVPGASWRTWWSAATAGGASTRSSGSSAS